MFIYRTILTILAPVLCVALLWRLLRSKETLAGLKHRLGFTARSPQPTIWVHGASVGELTAAKPLIEQLLAKDAGVRIHITANTYTGVECVLAWQNPRITAALAPLDYTWATKRFLARVQPSKMITLENEIWPNRFRLCHAKSIPVIVVAGRISSSAFNVWARLGGLAQSTMESVTLLAPGDAQSAERFVALGLLSGTLRNVLNLKAFVSLPQPDPPALARIQNWAPRSNTFLAASTHKGEDQIILDAFKDARQKSPDLRLVLAPRHPDRVPELMGLLKVSGLRFSSHTDALAPDQIGDVLIADTLGEMALWYSASFAAFVGGSLVDKGGHTPFEPAQFNCTIIHGPSTENHAAAYKTLAGIALPVSDANTLTDAILRTQDAFIKNGPATDAAKILSAGKTNDALAMLAAEIVAIPN